MGKIFLVGFGPGSVEQMTLRAREAIAQSEVVIGYSTYIKLVEDLLVGKEVIKKGMTEELDRSVLAYEKAKEGKTVALISSGDIGVYGMAGPTYEVLFEAGWTPQTGIEVEVVPGTTALSAAASLVGAPLTHDFCSISLSDLLTPWATIAKRLVAAAQADFVTALYNPKSGRRVEQIVEAQAIFLRHRNPATPAALVKSAYRNKQQIELIRLDQLAEAEIGMLTTVLIGNSNSFVAHGLLVTPRGYANKYLSPGGAAKTGERAGRSLSSGLEGWGAQVLEQILAGASPKEMAEALALPLGLVLEVLVEPGIANVTDPRRFLEILPKLGTLWATGSGPKILTKGDGWQIQGEQLVWDQPDAYWSLYWAEAEKVYLLERNQECSRALVLNRAGDLLVGFELTKTAGQFENSAVKALKSLG